MDEKNIRVFCRFRPFNVTETENKSRNVVKISKQTNVAITPEKKAELKFDFDYIFSELSTQEEVYAIVGQPLIEEILKGYNATVFAYGQSGSGKTTTMTGYPQLVDNADLLSKDNLALWASQAQMGIVPRIIKDLFEAIKSKKEYQYTIQVSYVEIYLEKIRDLLNTSNDDLEIRESRFKGLWIEDLTEVYVSSFDDAIKTVRKGELNRTVAATLMNAHSSRSHSLLIINLNQTNIRKQTKTTSRMVFVDLAGSEKVEKTKAEGIVLKQAQATNKSLLNLGIVIRALLDKQSHIPYRDSKLTRLLTDSLGGNSKTHLIVTCSPASYNIEETISTLRFGSVTQYIKNKPRVNLEVNVEEFKRLLLQANEKIATQQRIIKALHEDLISIIGVCETNRIDVSSFRKEYKENTFQVSVPNEPYEDSLSRLSKLTQEIEAKGSLINELQSTISNVHQEMEKYKDQIERLTDSLSHTQQDIETKNFVITELEVKIEELSKTLESLQTFTAENHTESEKNDTDMKYLDKINQEQRHEIVALKTKLTQMAEESQSARENTLRTSKSPTAVVQSDELKTLQTKCSLLTQTSDDLKQLVEGKNRHITVLEESIGGSNAKMQQLVTEQKKKNNEYEKKIKDLESQIRIIKTNIVPTNILTPLKY